MAAWLPPPGIWAVGLNDINVLNTAESQAPYKPLLNSKSPTLATPKKTTLRNADASANTGAYGGEDDDNSFGIVQLDFFSAHVLASAPMQAPRAASSSSGSAAKPADCCVDAAVFAGGLVWCADFCPPPRGVPAHAMHPTTAPAAITPPQPASKAAARKAAGPSSPSGRASGSSASRAAASTAAAAAAPDAAAAEEEEYMAVGSHPPGDNSHLTNTPVSGPGAVQLWALPHGAVSPSCPEGLPRCAMLLPHDGLVAWDVRWCPGPGCLWGQQPAGQQQQQQPGAGDMAVPVVGLLAMVLGDGSVTVTAVPDPRAVTAAVAAGRVASAGTVDDTGVGGAGQGGDSAADEAAVAGPSTAMVVVAATAAAEEGGGGGGEGGKGPEAMEGVEGAAGGAGDAAGGGGGGDDDDAGPKPGCGVRSGPAPPLIRLLRPAVVLRRESVGGALPSCCDWHLPDPRVCPPQLLVGSWDGSVALWRMPRGGGGVAGLERTQLLFHIPADVLPLRRVVSNPIWDTDFPPPSSSSSSSRSPGSAAAAAAAAGAGGPLADPQAAAAAAMGCGLGGRGGHPGGPAGHMFVTTGYTGRVKLWDDRDVSRPLLDRIIHRSYAHDATWTRKPSALALAQDDGGLRVVLFDAAAALFKDDGGSVGSVGFKEVGCGALWSVCYSPSLHALLYGGVDGLVGVMAWELPSDPRNRRCHVPLGGLVRDGHHLRLLSPEDVHGLQLFYPGGTSWRAQEAPSKPRPPHIIPDVQQQLYVVRAGYGNPAERRYTPPGESDGGRAGGKGGAAARPKSKGRPSNAALAAAAAADDEATGGGAWVMMGWRCGVMRFMRLSFE